MTSERHFKFICELHKSQTNGRIDLYENIHITVFSRIARAQDPNKAKRLIGYRPFSSTCCLRSVSSICSLSDMIHYCTRTIAFLSKPESTNAQQTVNTVRNDLGLAGYDAAYLETAVRRKLPLASRDRPLRETLRHKTPSVSAANAPSPNRRHIHISINKFRF
jgi:hypothetical protein